MGSKHHPPRWWRDEAAEREEWLAAQSEMHRIARERARDRLDADTALLVHRVGTLIPCMLIALLVFATVVIARGCDRSAAKPCPCAEAPSP